jgi:Flp pilus assembly protein TadD
MQKAFLAFLGVAAVFFAACATSGSGGAASAPYQVPQTVPPDNDPVYEGEGVSLAGQGEFESAIADFTEAIALNPNDALAKDNLELARKARGR